MAYRTTPPEVSELRRILALPLRFLPEPEDVEIESFERLMATAYEAGDRLLASQVAMVKAYEETGGGLFAVGVGQGKAGASILISQSAISHGRAKKVVLLVPVQLVASTFRRHLPQWRRMAPISASFHSLHRPAKARMRLASSGAPGIYILPYSLLSTPDTVDLLNALQADLVVADEAHKLRNPRSACTRRLLAYLKSRTPTVPLVAMSGTLTSKSVLDYHHLADAALRDGSPMPRSHNIAWAWSTILDSGAEPTPSFTAASLGPLVQWGMERFPADFVGTKDLEPARRAYARRLSTAPGVVVSGDERPKASLIFTEVVPTDQPSPELLTLINKAEKLYETPQGEQLDHAIHVYKWMHELSAGFYNSLVWPTVEELAKSRNLSDAEAEALLLRAKAHHGCLQEHHRGLREWFSGNCPPGLDTPREVGASIAKHGSRYVGEALASSWQRVQDADFQGRPERRGIPVRVCDWKIRAAVEWARAEGTGILWVYHQEIGRWLVEALKATGLDPLYAPAGADAALEAVGDPLQGGKGDRIAVASIPSHGIGRNLQAFSRQLFVQWPRNAPIAEQTIGRLHRTGQEADEVIAAVLLGVEFDHENRAATLSDSCYAQSTLTPMRVLYGDYVVAPKIYPPEFLRARGAAPMTLDAKQKAWLQERFGAYAVR